MYIRIFVRCRKVIGVIRGYNIKKVKINIVSYLFQYVGLFINNNLSSYI